MNKYIIYGAGKKGRAYLQFLHEHQLDNLIYGFCDKRANEINKIDQCSVLTIEEAKKTNLPFIVGVKKEYQDEVIKVLETAGLEYYEKLEDILVDELHLMDRVTFERDFCAVSHVDSMEEYFSNAELPDRLNVFWGDGVFKESFNKLELDAVVEIACGRGRHVQHYYDEAGRIVLVDILEKNIDYCKDRFRELEKISYVVNSGYDLSDLEDESYSAVFSYDAMVHFELLDIASYLKETYRILKHGGKALFHHSNNYSDYKASYADAIASRSFMSDRIFAYLAYRAGFEVLEQHLVDWEVPKLDCLTLLLKK